MFCSPARVLLFVLGVAAFAPRLTAAEPPAPKFRPEYTAFPDLKAPVPREAKGRNGTPLRVSGMLNEFPALAPLPADAPLLRKVRYEQARAGLDYFNDQWRSPLGKGYSWTGFEAHDPEWLLLATQAFPLAAEFERSLADRVMWYEARIRLFKEAEDLAFIGVHDKHFRPEVVNVIRFYRLGAEAELVELLAAVEREGPPPVPPPMVPPRPPGVVGRITEPVAVALEVAPPPHRAFPSGYTAFPDLTWHLPWLRPRRPDEQWWPDPDVRIGLPPTTRPVLPANASPLRKLEYEAAGAALQHLDRLTFAFHAFGMRPTPDFEYAAETYRLMANLERRPSDRIAWYEARVRGLKLWERRQEIRAATIEPPQCFHAARFLHLQMETDLIRLKAEAANASPAKEQPEKREEIEFVPRVIRGGEKIPQPYTAFPKLEGPTREVKEKRADGSTEYEWKGEVPRPKLPALGVDASRLRRLRFEQASEGLEAIEREHASRLESAMNMKLPIHMPLLTEAYRAAAALEAEPSDRVKWHEHHVRDCKRVENLVEAGIFKGIYPPVDLDYVRVFRFRAEMELLKLKETIEKPKR